MTADKEGDVATITRIGNNDSSLAKNFDFSIVDEWLGYNSSNDPTTLAENVYVQGSQNIYKKISGTLSVRQGQKRIGVANTATTSITSEFIWNTSWAATYPIWVTGGEVQVNINGTWNNLMSTTLTRFVFDKWYNQQQAKDYLLFVGGDNSLYQWSGGVATITGADNSTGHITNVDNVPPAGGSGYSLNDILTLGSGTGATVKVTSLGSGAILSSTLIYGGAVLPGANANLQPYEVGAIYPLQGGDISQGGQIMVATVDAQGRILTYTVVTEGTGYYAGVNYWVYNGFSNNYMAVIQVSSVATQGSITGIQLLTAGVGYSTGTVATTGGTGTGATISVLGIAQGSITASGGATLQQDGFSTSGTVLVNGTPYIYQYLIGNQFVGITTDPTGALGQGVQQVVTLTNLPISTATNQQASTFTNDFLKVVNNQVYLGSYKSRLCFISSSTDYTNFVVPTPRVAGDPELLTLDSTLNGIGIKGGNAYISYGEGEWASVTFQNNVTQDSSYIQQTIVTPFPVAKKAAAYAHEFISNSGDNIVYLSKDQQVRTIADYNNSFVNAYPSLSQEISTELMAENFTGGGLKCIADFTYVTAPNSGKTYLYQERQSVNSNNQVIIERLWHSPFIWNATRIDDYNGEVVAFSNANPQWYEVWDTDQWHDDSPSGEFLPYSCILALSYRTNGRRQGLFSFDKNYSEGYITPGTPLNVTVNYNYQGSTSQLMGVINSITQPATLFTATISSLGDSSLGDKPLGDEINADQTNNNDLPKFKVINSLAQVNCFEYQPVYSSDTADAQWELLASGTNVHIEPDAQSTFIINKKPLTN